MYCLTEGTGGGGVRSEEEVERWMERGYKGRGEEVKMVDGGHWRVEGEMKED